MSAQSEPPEPSSLSGPSRGVAIDRIRPTLRPRRLAVMRMNWRDLLFLHWPVPADTLRALIPRNWSWTCSRGRPTSVWSRSP